MSIYKNEHGDTAYWATWRTEDFLPHCMGLIDDYFNKLDKHGMLKLWEECYCAKHGTHIEHGHMSSKISFTGPNGEVVVVFANVFRNLLKHVANNVTAMTPDTQPVAANSDYEVKAQIHACKNVQEHYRAALNLREKYRKVVDYQLLYGIGYFIQFWDEEAQELRAEAVSPRRVIVDLESYHKPKWAIWVERISRWDAIAKYNVPEEHYADITNYNRVHNGSIPGWYFDTDDDYNSDYVDIFHFWHARTPALPQGRYTIFCNDHVSFTDHLQETLPFEYFPVHPFVPEEIAESPFGYSIAFDLLGQQKLINSTLSSIFTGQDKNKTIVAVPTGTSDPLPVEGDPNLSIVKIPPSSQPGMGLQSIQIFNVPEQLFKTLQVTQSVAQQLAGLNDTAMGNSSAKSGSHAALLFSVTQQFQSTVIDSYVDMIEDADTARISLIKNCLPGPITLRIAGSDKQVYVDTFEKEDISHIAGVVRAKGVSPLLSTPSGRLTVSEQVMKMPPEERRQFIRLLETGQLDDSEDFRDSRDEDMLLTAEREVLSRPENLTYVTVETERFDGKPDRYIAVKEIRALVGQNHKTHIRSHKAMLSSPRVLNNPELVKAIRTHIHEHLWLWTWGPRQMLLISGLEPMPPEGGEAIKPDKKVPANAVPNLAEQTRTGQTPNPRDLPRQPNQPVNPMNPTVSGQALAPPGPAAM